MKIAICDDDNGACEELRKILENISTEKDMIHIYNAGEELLGDISNGYIYDVVYLDIELPGLNGVEVGQVLREQVEKQHLDLIFISQKSSYCEQLFDLEPRRFYRKPFDKERIIKDLEERVYFDILFLDIEMKKMDGVMVGHYIREQLHNDSMLIIYISSYTQYAMELIMRRCLMRDSI